MPDDGHDRKCNAGDFGPFQIVVHKKRRCVHEKCPLTDRDRCHFPDGVCDWGDCRIELCFVDGVVSGDLIGYLVQQEYFNVEN
jgi:hypothetical protein